MTHWTSSGAGPHTPRVTASVSMPPSRALRAGLWLVWTAIRHPRTPVRFDFGEEVR